MSDVQTAPGRNPIARRRALRRELAVRGSVSVAELSQVLGASAATVRRDLEALSREGLLERSYGGAAVRSTRPAEEALAVRAQRYVEEKAAVAQAAMALIEPGNTLFLNDGSTVMALAQELATSEIELFVVTSAVNIAHVLVANPRITVCLLGGFVRSTSLATGGQFAEAMIDQFNADLALLSCDAFGAAEGMSFMHADDAAVARRMRARAKRAIALAIHPKFSASARITAVPAANIDGVVTDRMPPDVRQSLAQHQIKIVEARRAPQRPNRHG
ncbi:MAG: DeoR/GlpR transcriptional regulator [Rhodospirillales bacterium]|nr:DeoR/GlpR transcriptional regulator [Rhodospirillales bacterium]